MKRSHRTWAVALALGALVLAGTGASAQDDGRNGGYAPGWQPGRYLSVSQAQR